MIQRHQTATRFISGVSIVPEVGFCAQRHVTGAVTIYTSSKRNEKHHCSSTTLSSETQQPISSSSSLSRVLLEFKGGQIAARAITGILVAPLDVGVEPVQLLPVLAHHRIDNVSGGDHPQHPCVVDHRDVSDTVLCMQISTTVPWSISVLSRILVLQVLRARYGWFTCH
jgi:hypothetical protein